MNFLQNTLPDGVIFNVFVTFTSLVIAFRTSEALTRYTDGAKLIHTLSASWFDAGSALLAFAKVSDAYDQGRKDEVEAFKETLVRLISLLSALCFDTLQGSDGRQALLAKERALKAIQGLPTLMRIRRDRLCQVVEDERAAAAGKAEDEREKAERAAAVRKAKEDAQKREIEAQQREIEALKAAVGDDFGKALLVAAQNNEVDLVERLIKAKACLEATDQKYRSTPLHWAAYRGHLEVVKLLVEACLCGHLEVVKFLVQAGVQLNPNDKDRRTPLKCAEAERHEDVVAFLRAQGAIFF
mmetsp:Transcript_59687/g.169175  ORF Transcript_59687/g.169175 Transcript_59687/m.169175 type:complete len:298 (+) Transcript_59687:1-894(+)